MTTRDPFDPEAVAAGALDRCCEGDPWPTARNIGRMLVALARLALTRAAQRVRTQPRSLLRWHVDPRFGGRFDPDPLPDCSCAMTEGSMTSCPIHGYDPTEEALAAWEAARR